MNKHLENGYAGIGLINPKFEHNVGSVMRAAGCYGAAFVVTTGKRYHGSGADTQSQIKRTPLFKTDRLSLKDFIPHDCVPVAVDLIEGAIPLPGYIHPKRAFYIFGPEDGTLGQSITSWCRDVIYIPTAYCMNLAATVNVVLYDRLAKR